MRNCLDADIHFIRAEATLTHSVLLSGVEVKEQEQKQKKKKSSRRWTYKTDWSGLSPILITFSLRIMSYPVCHLFLKGRRGGRGHTGNGNGWSDRRRSPSCHLPYRRRRPDSHIAEVLVLELAND